MGRCKNRVHWNDCFGMNISYLEPISCVSSSCVSSACTIGGGCSSWPLHGVLSRFSCVRLCNSMDYSPVDGGHPGSILSSLRMKLQSGCGNVIVKWLQHLLFTDMTGNIFYSHFPNVPGRRKWQPTPVFLPRESHGQGSLVGCCP